MRPIEGYRRNWGPQDPLKRDGLTIPGCPWTKAQLEIVASIARGEKHKTIAMTRKCAVGTVGTILGQARLAAFSNVEDPLPLRELIKSPRVQGWLEEYRRRHNEQGL